ncbi:MAG: SIMPL domain-containing protein, partial [Spirochaetales bacterium]|nr:SIMPL domain-containing protein [Candidatus Physcosoma equi]
VNMKKIFLLAMVLAAVVLVSLTGCTTLKSGDAYVSTVTVSASGSASAQPDIATFTITAEMVKPTTEEARNASSEMIASAVAFLKDEFHLEDEAIKTLSMNFSPYYEWIDGVRTLVGQEVWQSIRITLEDNLDDAGRIYDRLSVLDGISVSSVSYSRKDNSKELEKARMNAVENARAKAEAYAKGLGLKVGEALSISDGTESTPVYRANKTTYMVEAAMVADASYTSTTYYTGDITVSDSVSVVFRLY